MFSNLDFTQAKYAALCGAVAASRYRAITMADHLRPGQTDAPACLIMRHDIDRTPRRALDLAKVEHQYGIRATYYFRARRETYVPSIIDQIAALGHEIGYHYETIDKSHGDVKKAQQLFAEELAGFRSRYDVDTVCAHGNPLTKYDNKNIWGNLPFSHFGLLGEAFLSLDYGKFAYLSDSGRTWLNNESQKMPGKDSVKTAFDSTKARRTDDVIAIIEGGTLPSICILSHPERWTGSTPDFVRRYLLDLAFSGGKAMIHLYREARGSR